MIRARAHQKLARPRDLHPSGTRSCRCAGRCAVERPRSGRSLGRPAVEGVDPSTAGRAAIRAATSHAAWPAATPSGHSRTPRHIGTIAATALRAALLAGLVLILASARPALAGPGPLPDAPPDEYAAGLDRARSLHAAGRSAEAAAALEPLAETYPDDYPLALELGWLHFEAGNAKAASGHYRRAIALSGGAEEARLGLAWSLMELGDYDAAEDLFLGLLEDSPGLARARQGLAALRMRTRIRAQAGFVYIDHAGHPFRSSGWGLDVGVESPVARYGVIAGKFRFARLSNRTGSTASGSGPGSGGPGGGGPGSRHMRGSAGVAQYDQQELYVSTGWRTPGLGARAHLAYVHDEDEFADDLVALGVSGRLSRLGDLRLEASVALYSDDPFVRISPSWRVEPMRGIYLEPGAALQIVDGQQVLGSGFAEAGWRGRRAALWLGGKGGRERRPVYLALPLMVNLVDDIVYGLWAGASWHASDRVELRAVYQLDRLDPAIDSTGARSSLHSIAASVVVSL